MAGRAAAARVDRTHGERGCRPARPADAAVGRSGRPVVSGRSDDERVEGGGSRGGGGERAVGERGEGLDDADERHPGGVVGVTVLVRVDCELDPGQQLVGAAVDGDPARRIGLPAGHTDGKERDSRRDPLQAGRSVGAGDETRHLGAVPLGPPRSRRVLARARIADRVEDVEAAEQRAANVRVDEIDPGVEQRDGHPRPRVTGDADVGAPPAGGVDDRVDRIGIRGRRDRRPHREDAPHVGVALDDRERLRVERRRKAVEDARVRVLRLERRPVEREARDDVTLARAAPRPSSSAPAPPLRPLWPRRRAWRATASRA